MPKTFNDYERAAIKEDMLKIGSALLRNKGITQISIRDIAKAVKIATGSFYSFYNSKEELLWEVCKMEERRLIEQIRLVASQDLDIKTKMRKIFHDVYLHEDSPVHYLPAEDMEFIKRKMPPEILEEDFQNGYSIHGTILTACNIEPSEDNIEVSFALQTLILSVCNGKMPLSKSAKEEVLNVLIEGIAAYFSDE